MHYIRLYCHWKLYNKSRVRDNLGEPQELGFGLDLKGFQSSIEFVDMQAHSLKPQGGTDMNFILNNSLIMGYGVGGLLLCRMFMQGLF